MAAGGDLYEQLVDTANAIYGAHAHRRAFHSKGTWCSGTFTATSEAAGLSRAKHLQGDPVPALIRFSSGGGNPEGHDAQREARGIAVKLRPADGEETDILAVTTPAFVVRTPEEFLELLRLRTPDPDTGQPDMEKLGAFLGMHPESQTAIQATVGSEPPASFATLTYFSPHSFKLVSADGAETWVRYRWRPEAGEASIPDDEARERGRDYLGEELAERLRGDTAGFTTPSPTTTSRSSTPPGSWTASSCRTTRSCTRERAPTLSRPTGGSGWRSRTRRPRRAPPRPPLPSSDKPRRVGGAGLEPATPRV